MAQVFKLDLALLTADKQLALLHYKSTCYAGCICRTCTASPGMCRFWFRLLKVCQTVSIAPLETYKAVTVTSGAAKEVVQEICTDSIERARHAVEEARAVAERSRAKADLMEDRPCPEVHAQTLAQSRGIVSSLECLAVL